MSKLNIAIIGCGWAGERHVNAFRELSGRANVSIEIPAASKILTPFLLSVPLQFLAYHVAVHLGTDVDQPRNLAKSVTVE